MKKGGTNEGVPKTARPNPPKRTKNNDESEDSPSIIDGIFTASVISEMFSDAGSPFNDSFTDFGGGDFGGGGSSGGWD